MAGTLILSRIEHTMILQHLETQYGLICKQVPLHPDCKTLHLVMTRMAHDTVIGMTTLEALVTLRHLRFQHRRLDDDLLSLEERRLRGGHNGDLDAAHRALDAEATILADVLRRLWDLIAT